MEASAKDWPRGDVACFDGHSHLAMEIAVHRTRTGEGAAFSKYLAPRLRHAGLKTIMMNVGGDNKAFTHGSDHLFWGTLWIMDMIHAESTESADTLRICLDGADIQQAMEEDKIGVVLGIEGCRPLEGKENMDTFVNLHTLHRLGLRHLQLVCTGRSRIGDGDAETVAGGLLTGFGIDVIKEASRLGMIVDTAHLQDSGFWQAMKHFSSPVVDSHSNCTAICENSRNVKDDRIKAIASLGGVIGLRSSAVSASKNFKRDGKATVNDLIDHVDHVVELVGVDHVGIGADFDFFSGAPTVWEPAPGWVEGRYYGESLLQTLDDFSSFEEFPNVTSGLRARGYAEDDVKKIMGGNLRRVYGSIGTN